jgi:hypothetical protein
VESDFNDEKAQDREFNYVKYVLSFFFGVLSCLGAGGNVVKGKKDEN